MTQIVYDGLYLYADRKGYAGSRVLGETIKLKSTVIDGVIYYFAFAGSFADCAIGERVVESGFDPHICKEAVQRLGHENLQDAFFGIVVETPADPTAFFTHKVYLVNYAGDKREMKPFRFLAVGAGEQSIRDVHRACERFCDDQIPTEDIIRCAVRGTEQTLDGHIIDRVSLKDGEYAEV